MYFTKFCKLALPLMKVNTMFRRKTKAYDCQPTTTILELINLVRKDYDISNTNFGAQLDGKILKYTDKVGQLGLNNDSVILLNIEASASAQPMRRPIYIPRRTDIDSDMKAPDNLEDRISRLVALFPQGQAPDREIIITALENSNYNTDRAADYLLPPNEKTESPLTTDQKREIVELTKLGYTPGTAIQIYFACENLDQAKALIITLPKEV